MDALLKTVLEAPLPNLLIVAGLVFVGLSVLGGISGKLEPGREGRIAAGIVGTLLLLVGILFSASGTGVPAAANTSASSPLEAPVSNLLIVAGLLFVGVGVLGGITGKFEPDRQGRLAAGGLGGVLLLIGFVMVFKGTNTESRAQVVTPATAAAAAPTTVAVAAATLAVAIASPSQPPAATPLPGAFPANTATSAPLPQAARGQTATPLPTAAPASGNATASASNLYVPSRALSITVLANGDMAFVDTWTVQFGPRALRQFSTAWPPLTGLDQQVDGFAVSEGGVPYAQGSRQADDTYEVSLTTSANGARQYTVNWYFPSSANQTRTFALRYVWHSPMPVGGDGMAVLKWRPMATARPWITGSARVSVKLPRLYDPAQLYAQAHWSGVDGPGARIVDGQNIEFTRENVLPDQFWDIEVHYPAQ